MSRFLNVSLKTKVLLVLMGLSVACSAVIVGSVYDNARRGMTKNIFKHLTSVRAAKENQLEKYFERTTSIVKVLGDNPTVHEATKAFKEGFQKLHDEALLPSCRDSLTGYYRSYLDKLSKNLEITDDPELYYPTTKVGCYLQYEYIVDSLFDAGEKSEMKDAGDGSAYNRAHIKYHELFKDIISRLGFYDIFLVDLETGDIVYTAFKEADFATNLFTGPYKRSNFAELARTLSDNRDLREPVIVDYRNYRPSYGAPASFMGIPLTEGAELIGALVVQLPSDEIDDVMTGRGNWRADGLGETGQTYLVGEDFLMRSTSRPFREDPEAFKSSLEAVGLAESNMAAIESQKTTILNMRVRTKATQEALAGRDHTEVIDDYRGVPVLSSYAPVRVPGLKWAMLSEIEQSEAYQELGSLKINVFATFALLLMAITILCTWAADRMLLPLEAVKGAIESHKAGKLAPLEDLPKGEFSQLTSHFNDMAAEIRRGQEELQEVTGEHDKVLHNFIPELIANRMKAGEEDIVEQHSNVSLIIVDIVDFTDLVSVTGERDAIAALNELIEAFDVAAKKHHVEKIRTLGDNYFGSCGLFTPRMDHTKRMVDYAVELQQLIGHFNARRGLSLGLVIGINSGPVTSGIVGKTNFTFDLLGQTVNELFEISELKRVNEIIVAESVYQKTRDFFEFEPLATPLDFTVHQLMSFVAEKA